MSLRSRLNLVIVQALIISLMLALAGRLFYLQVADGLTYQDAALSIQSRDVVNPAIRGAIVDSSGIPLVMDRPGLVISADRSTLDKCQIKVLQFGPGCKVGRKDFRECLCHNASLWRITSKAERWMLEGNSVPTNSNHQNSYNRASA